MTMSNFSNSPLVNLTRISPHRNSPRNQPIRKLTIHHTAGVLSLENLLAFLARPDTRASYNYVIGDDGRVGLCVEERDRCWGSSSGANDHQAVVIGVVNSASGGEWPVGQLAMATLLDLMTDICTRNGIDWIDYDGTPNGTLTRHNMFTNTLCPGPFLQRRFVEIAKTVNARLSPATQERAHWAEEDWLYLNENGIIVNEKRFSDPVTRGETVTLLARLHRALTGN